MGAVAQFDWALFELTFPEFTGLTQPVATSYFNTATMYLSNDGSGPVADAGQQLTLLNLLTAHITKILFGSNGQGPSGIVGRISSATEGSVSAGTDFPTTLNGAWLAQTAYGALYWQLTAQYRTMQYRPRLGRNFNPYPFAF